MEPIKKEDKTVIDLKSRRLELGLTLEDVGDIVGVGKSTVRKWENGIIDNMKRDKIALLAHALQISPLQILSDDYQPTNNIISIYNQLNKPRQHKVYTFAEHQLEEQNNVIHLVDRVEEDSVLYATSEQDLYGGVSAGTGQTVFNTPVEQVTIPINIIPKQPYDIMLKVVGDSMEPAFKDGEYVFIKKTKEIRSGQFVVVIIDGEAYLKKAYLEDDFMRFVSLNEKYEDIIVTADSTIEIVGVVVL